MAADEYQLNERATRLCDEIAARAEALGVSRQVLGCGTMVFDFGVVAAGGDEAGVWLARVCLADLADVQLAPGEPWPVVTVSTDEPVAACLASQYAGWEIKGEKFFAIGSGPMRAAAAREPLFEDLGYREQASQCVGVLEASKLPPESVCREIAAKCRVEPERLTLLVARTSSPAGTLQVVARSVETALHKLHELGFDLSRIERGRGSAPLPPVAEDDLAAIGVANDAVLYGGEVTLWVRGDDRSLVELGPRVPSSASPDYGRPFAEVLAGYDNDFYRVDPLLFSAAAVTLVNLDTGRQHHFGQPNPAVLQRSFAGD
jgi:methenyltetrahydromethanopterin cyclohydrolase